MDTIFQTFKYVKNNLKNFQNNFNKEFSNLKNQLYALHEKEKYVATVQEEKKLKEHQNNFNVNLNYHEHPNCELQDEKQAARSIPDGEIIKCELNIPRDDIHPDREYHRVVYVEIFCDTLPLLRVRKSSQTIFQSTDLSHFQNKGDDSNPSVSFILHFIPSPHGYFQVPPFHNHPPIFQKPNLQLCFHPHLWITPYFQHP